MIQRHHLQAIYDLVLSDEEREEIYMSYMTDQLQSMTAGQARRPMTDFGRHQRITYGILQKYEDLLRKPFEDMTFDEFIACNKLIDIIYPRDIFKSSAHQMTGVRT